MDYQSLVAFNGWTFIAQILNLFIQLYLFKRFLFKPIKDILAKRQAEAAAMKQKAETDIELARRKAVNEMKGEISELAVSIASKVVSKDLTAEDHERLIEQFIEDLGDEA